MECLYIRAIIVSSAESSIPIQGSRHTKDVIKMVPVVSLLSTEH